MFKYQHIFVIKWDRNYTTQSQFIQLCSIFSYFFTHFSIVSYFCLQISEYERFLCIHFMQFVFNSNGISFWLWLLLFCLVVFHSFYWILLYILVIFFIDLILCLWELICCFDFEIKIIMKQKRMTVATEKYQ